MSTLEESLAERRADKETKRSCTLARIETSTLVLSLWQREKWVLPWSQFVSARFASENGGQHLELSFGCVCVVITGENLHGLVDALATLRVSALCDLPAQFAPRCGQGEPFISRLEVRPAATVPKSEKHPA
jgi:hypothetical protein